MDTFEGLFGLPALILAVLAVARIVGRVATPSGPGTRIRRSGAPPPSDETDLALPSLDELVLDPRYQFSPTNVWYEHYRPLEVWPDPLHSVERTDGD